MNDGDPDDAGESEQGLVDAWRKAGLSEEEIGRRLGMSVQQVGQWFGQRSATWLEGSG